MASQIFEVLVQKEYRLGAGAAFTLANMGRGEGTERPMAPAILVVDDEPEIRNFLRLLLEGEGYRVRIAADGEEAASLAATDPPDLVLTDWSMPRLGGDGLCALLRRRERTRQIPVVLMSAVTSSASADYAGFLAKPFDLDQMLGIIRECLNPDPPVTPSSCRR